MAAFDERPDTFGEDRRAIRILSTSFTHAEPGEIPSCEAHRCSSEGSGAQPSREFRHAVRAPLLRDPGSFD